MNGLRLGILLALPVIALMLPAAPAILAQTASGKAAAAEAYNMVDQSYIGGLRDKGNAHLPTVIVPQTTKQALVKSDGSIVLLDTSKLPATREVIANPLPMVPTRMVATADGRSLVLSGNDAGTSSQIARIDIASGSVGFRMAMPAQQIVSGLAVSPDGSRIAVITGGKERRLLLIDGATGNELFSADPQSPVSVNFSADGSQIVTAGSDKSGRRGIIEVWNATTGERSRTLTHNAPVSDAVFSPDSQRLAVINTSNYSASVLRLPDGAEAFTLMGHTGALRSIAFSPDGTRLVTGSSDFTAKVWDARTGAPIATLDGHRPSTTAPAPSSIVGTFVLASFLPQGRLGNRDFGAGSIATFDSGDVFNFWEDGPRYRQRQAENFQRDLEKAEAGDPLYMSLVSGAYERGSGGAPKDLELAQDWLERAATTGRSGPSSKLANRLIGGSHRKQDCAAAATLLSVMKPPEPTGDSVLDSSTASVLRVNVETARANALKALGGDKGIAGMAPQVQADLLEAQMLDALTKQDNKAFLDNLCASEFLGHADNLPPAARNELYFHRAVALRATGKPVAALDALNTYLNSAGRDGSNYQQAIMMLRPLQAEATKK